jgi:hypothetical protein
MFTRTKLASRGVAIEVRIDGAECVRAQPTEVVERVARSARDVDVDP